jgi:hypothetical protein
MTGAHRIKTNANTSRPGRRSPAEKVTDHLTSRKTNPPSEQLCVIPIEEFAAGFCVQVHKSDRGGVSDKMQLALALAQLGHGFSKLSHRPVRLG